MTANCPLCGGPIEDSRFWIIEDRGLVGIGGKYSQLTSREFSVFKKLWNRRPNVVTPGQLMDDIYQLENGDEPHEKIIDVFICKVRKKLSPLGVNIMTARASGYFIAVEAGVDDGWLT